MLIQNAQLIKDKILKTLETRGPSLPVHLAKEANQSILFTSAFLSELLSEKKIFQTYMRVGSSAVYFLRGQEPLLENFQMHIKGKEKEALLKLKEERFLEDENQNPPIRVALRFIKDFAIPFQKEGKIIWRYFIEDESNYKQNKKIIEHQKIKEELNIFDDNSKRNESSGFSKSLAIQTNPTGGSSSSDELVEGNSKSSKEQPIKKELVRKTIKKKIIKKATTKQDDKFFNKVKEFLSQNSIELLEIEGFNKTSVTLKIKKNSKELLLIAHNKKKLEEKDFIEAHNKANEKNLKYMIISTGEQTKKLVSFIKAIQNLEEIEKIE